MTATSHLLPFSAVVGQDQLKLALLLNAIDPGIGGVLVRGHKGTAKSTTVRALAALLPSVEVAEGCAFACAPGSNGACPDGPHQEAGAVTRPARLVELPVGASEDRLVGSLDLERALVDGQRAFEPGLLAKAHRGVLYVDEVNLLGDHLVDLLLDAAAMGRNHVEREGISISHPARFLLVGTMNPEEGELRPQLLDRFGLTVEVVAPTDPQLRAEVVRRRLDHERDPDGVAARFAEEDKRIAERLTAARDRRPKVTLPEALLIRIVEVCAALEVDGLRADIVTARAATAMAAWEGRDRVTLEDVREACLLALPHRRRRGPFEDPGLDPDELDRLLGDDPDPGPDDPSPDDPDDPGPGDHGDPGDAGDPGQDPAGGGGSQGGSQRGRDPDPDRPRARLDDAGARTQAPDGDDGVGASAETPEAPPATAGPVEVHGVGASFTPTLLTVPGVGAGAWGRRSRARGQHGATVGARPVTATSEPRPRDLALAATVRAAAPHQRARGRAGGGLVLRRDDLRTRVREGREGNLVVLVVDASGSMGARARMVAVKGAVRSLLHDAYKRRDRVALVMFRGTGAEVVLPPTSSVELADRRLATLPTGGRTPLAAGLETAAHLVATAARRDPDRRPLVVLLTDGRANDAGAQDASGAMGAAERAGQHLAARGTAAVVIDTEQGFVRLGLARRVAAALLAPCLELEELAAAPLARTLRTLTGAGRTTA